MLHYKNFFFLDPFPYKVLWMQMIVKFEIVAFGGWTLIYSHDRGVRRVRSLQLQT